MEERGQESGHSQCNHREVERGREGWGADWRGEEWRDG